MNLLYAISAVVAVLLLVYLSVALLKPETLAGLANLDLVARAVVNGFLTGMHRSPFFGFSQEFAEYRAYAEGDDYRELDWNLYGRLGQLFVKRFAGETDVEIRVVVDGSASMGVGDKDLEARRLAAVRRIELFKGLPDAMLTELANKLSYAPFSRGEAVTHEGAHDVDDLLDRRTRVGLVPADRALAVPAAERALALAGARL